MAVCRASCALNATLLSRLLRNRHCQSLLIVRLVVAGGDVYRRRPQQVGAPKMRRSFVFVSGQLGIDPATGELAGETAGEQAAQALKNIKHILDTAGTGIEHVCRATIYLKNVEDFKEVDARYAEVFIGSVKPARVAFGNNMIPKGALVEIDAIAVE